MKKLNSPQDYFNFVNDLGKSTQELNDELTQQLEVYLKEVDEIIIGLEKGLRIMQENQRKPEQKVLDNYELLKQTKQNILKL